MKLRYFIGTLLIGLGLFSACQEEKPEVLSEIQVSESYVSIDVNGSTSTINVNATEDWSVVAESVPEWLTINPMSGTAGETALSFIAEATTSTRTAEVKILCNGKTQFINVIQYAAKVDPEVITVEEALALIKAVDPGDGQNHNVDGIYRVKGFVTKITEMSTQYGNATYYLSDDGVHATGHVLQVFRGLWINGAAITTGNEFAVGDALTVETQLMSYKGTPETVEKTAIVIEHNPSLIKVEGLTLLDVEEGEGITEFPLEGGSIKVNLSVKGDEFHVSIPAEAKSWLHIEDFGAAYVTLKADANPGGDRNATVTFTTTKDGTAYSCEQTFTQKGAILEVSVATFLAAEVGDTQYRLTGVVSKGYDSDSQGQSFYIKDYSGETLVYRLNDFKASGAQVGDVITVVGKRGDFRGNPQMVNGVYEKHIATVKGKTLAEIAAAADASDVYYLATGTVKEIANETYGNVYLTDDSGDLFVYGCYPGWGATGDNRKGAIAAYDIKVGDKLSVIGIKSTKNGAAQIANGVYFSHEAAGDVPPGPEPGVDAAYTKVTSITSGKKYLFVANNVNGKTYAATALSSSSNYGRLNGTEVTVDNDAIANSVSENLEFTFTQVEGGWNIAMSDGRLLAADATHNGTFQIGDSYPHTFTVAFREDGTITMVHAETAKTFYHGGGTYTNFSLVTTVPDDGVYPSLFEKAE